MPRAALDIPMHRVAAFCRRRHIRRLSLFGSVLRDDFRPDSDVDLLVEFEPGRTPSWEIVTMQEDLSEMFGRPVDLRTPSELNPRIRDGVSADAEVLYAAPDPTRRDPPPPRPMRQPRRIPMAERDALYLGHMLDTARKAQEKVRGKNRADFDQDENLRLAVVHLLQTLGEAANRASTSFRETHADLPWRRIIGMRHRLVHDYVNVDEGIVWNVATNELEGLIRALETWT